jgi:hypothetical protein
MCEPTIIIGVSTAVLGGIQSIAGYQQQQAQASYQNQIAQAQYQQEVQAYQINQQAYQQQIEANAAAANRAYQREQLKLQEKQAEAKQKAQDLLIEKLQSQGQVLASGRTGQSLKILVSDAERDYGKDLANLGTNLGYAMQSYSMTAEDIYRDAESANNVAASQRMLKPISPIATPGPSTLGLVAGLGQAALGGYSAYSSLKAPNPGTNVPKPGTARAPGMPGTSGSTASNNKPYYGPAF